MGRKSKYEDNVKPYLKEVKEWRKIGVTEEKIAERLGISVASLNEYKKKYPEFSENQNFFMANGKIINKYKTLEQNGIKNSDVIVLNEIE